MKDVKRFISCKQLLATLIIIISHGCRQKVDWTPPDFEGKPVVSSVVRSGSPIAVKVGLASAYSAPATPIVDNAEVQLYADSEYAETLEYIGDGFYQSELVAQEGTEYRLEVTIPGYPTAICSTHVPYHREILGVEYINKAGVDEEGFTYPGIRLTFDNVVSTPTYYQVIITLFKYNNKPQVAWLNSIVDPILLNEGLPIAVFSNEFIKSSSYIMVINLARSGAYNYNNTGWITRLYPLQVELRTVSYDYYQFVKQQYLYEQANGDPIFSVGASPIVSLHGNVENGYGIFAGYSSVTSDTIYPLKTP